MMYKCLYKKTNMYISTIFDLICALYVCLQKHEKGVRLKKLNVKCLEGGSLNSLTYQKYISYFDGLIIIDIYLITQMLSATYTNT